jgi:hypothetical protein
MISARLVAFCPTTSVDLDDRKATDDSFMMQVPCAVMSAA